jgi:formylglycine-generating enzyme required for sulfatase activity
VRGGKKVVTITREEQVASVGKPPQKTAKSRDPVKPTKPRERKPLWERETEKPREKVQERPEPPPSVKYVTNSIGMKLAPIKPGEFLMGAPREEMQRFKRPDYDTGSEGPVHRVRITRPFLMGAYPVTLRQYVQFMQDTSYQPIFRRKKLQPIPYRQTPDSPVIYVTWEDANAFCDWLSKKEGRNYRLPTEAEWEYACRAGSRTAFFFGDDPNQLRRYGWFEDNAEKKAHPVGLLAPNPWGLYDMCGNVYQWTGDWYAPDYYKNSPVDDPAGHGPTTLPGANAPFKVMRGGEYSYFAGACRSAARKPRGGVNDYATARTGFRVVCETGR